eukprot:TRINITY_DN22182_c0_g1_i1.p1 TRINITY_DN22182_c0_g1~~TRINITY_DN22182_c0_g1_i1.p1  ORF type:complete len:632 (-),score=93.21 TRINITY_DN22182_c0_g1_i1:394-2103(-)
MATQSMQAQAALTQHQGSPAVLIALMDNNRRYLLGRDTVEVQVGRHPASTVFVTDKRVSSCHLRIYHDDAFRYFVKQMSPNGSYVNADHMKQGHTRALQHGDEISICVPGPGHSRATVDDDQKPFAAFLFRTNTREGSDRGHLPSAVDRSLSGRKNRSYPSDVVNDVTGDRVPESPLARAGGSTSSTSGPNRCVSDKWVRDHWDMRLQLGMGNFSEVRLGVEVASGEKRAVKVIDKKKFLTFQNKRESQLSLSSEAEVLMSVDHPGIVRCFDWFQTEASMYLVMEFVEGGDLLQCIVQQGGFTESQARHFFKDLCEAVDYLHKRCIIHRDIKPENVLLTLKDRDKARPKLTDFGLSRKNMRSRDCRTFCGTPHYFAPEVINTFLDRESGAAKAGYGMQADMWSLGVVLYILLSGIPPFEDDGLYDQILEGKYEFDVNEWTSVSREAKELVQRLMTVDPKGRLTIARALEHSWLATTPSCMAPTVVASEVTNGVPTAGIRRPREFADSDAQRLGDSKRTCTKDSDPYASVLTKSPRAEVGREAVVDSIDISGDCVGNNAATMPLNSEACR